MDKVFQEALYMMVMSQSSYITAPKDYMGLDGGMYHWDLWHLPLLQKPRELKFMWKVRFVMRKWK